SQIADRIGVMYAGRMVEIAATTALFRTPKHPYTRGLIGSILDVTGDGRPAGAPLKGLLRRAELPPGCPFAPRCDYALPRCSAEPQTLEPAAGRHGVACWRWREIEARGREDALAPVRRPGEAAPLLVAEDVTVAYYTRRGLFPAARDIAFHIAVGETFALVGESGSGKSTIARAVGGLLAPVKGRILLGGQPLAGRVHDRTPDERRRIQFIFQNPDASLNPRARVGAILARPLEFFFGLDAKQRRARILSALDEVRLDESYVVRYPDELSGGERQRVAIARALIAEPSLLLCDEVLSALDVSVQASVLSMLARLRAERDVAMLFISHDLAVVRSLADRVGVLYGGELMETGTRDELFAPPFHPYTHTLLTAVPVPLQRTPAPPQRRAPPPPLGQGCVYAGRCPWQAGKICETERPPWREAGGSLRIRCHLPLDELAARAHWPARKAEAPRQKVAGA
ncbi:MAG: oligopeptide/dipeptide ABC transporter ATP-binding protein, partial [Parvibaculaceae bacterium]